MIWGGTIIFGNTHIYIYVDKYTAITGIMTPGDFRIALILWDLSTEARRQGEIISFFLGLREGLMTCLMSKKLSSNGG